MISCLTRIGYYGYGEKTLTDEKVIACNRDEAVGPPLRILPAVRWGHARLLFRWFRFGLRSLFTGDFDFVRNACLAQGILIRRGLTDLLFDRRHSECNLCGWCGGAFFPNVGPGYFELATTCPACLSQDRHRALVMILDKRTTFFHPASRVVEVAPMRSFQKFCLQQKKNQNYISFDLNRFAMEKGDITRMRYDDRSLDYFLCFHVLEHIPDVDRALREIHRVLRPSGCAILQVPIDWSLEQTYEYDAPDPREVGHVRRYGRDFGELIAAYGFQVNPVSVADWVGAKEMERFGLSKEAVLLATAQERE